MARKRHPSNFYDGLMFLSQNGCPARYTNFINHSLCFGVRLFREQGDDHHCDEADGHADYAEAQMVDAEPRLHANKPHLIEIG